MDQSASLRCQAGHALLLDCRSLGVSQVPFDPGAAGAALLLVNTRARHALSDGEYGRRRAECEEAARRLDVPSLRSITDPAEVERLGDPVLRRRARHVVADDQRVLEVVALLRSLPGSSGSSATAPGSSIAAAGPSAAAAGSAGAAPGSAGAAGAYGEIGRLLSQAHASLRDDFEVSWPEADVAVEAALAAGAAGARMIGGGFGGSVLALAPSASLDAVRDSITSAFAERAWTAPEFLSATPADAARRMM
jgi:galactokinase